MNSSQFPRNFETMFKPLQPLKDRVYDRIRPYAQTWSLDPNIDQFPGSKLVMGDHSYDEPRLVTFFDHEGRVEVGKYSSVHHTVEIIVGGNHHPEWVSTYAFRHRFGLAGAGALERQPWSQGPVIIGNDAWIGWRSVILSGVTIGHGAVVAAASVVTKNVEPYEIVGGNPARPIRRRFSDSICDALLQIAWWDWPEEKVVRHIDQLCNPDIEAFVRLHEPGGRTADCKACQRREF